MASSRLLSTLKEKAISLKQSANATTKPTISQPYLIGLRGVVALSSLLWLFLQTFAPATVSHTSGATWQYIIRDVFASIFWNQSLICAFFIILSARTACIPFLSNPCAATLAGSLMRRPLRIGLSISIASAVGIIVFSQIGTSYFATFNSLLPGSTVKAPTTPPTRLAGFLSIYNLLWLTKNFAAQAANQLWPSNTMWVPSLIYYQSYTVYILMVLLPFTRPAWHAQGLFLFACGSFWLNTWGWYSATGLLIADYVMKPELRKVFKAGFGITQNFSLPVWFPASVSILAGLVMKYMWTAAFPQHINAELNLHPIYHTQDDLSVAAYDLSEPYGRMDDWLVVVGVLLLVESFPMLQNMLSASCLQFIGQRSLSKSKPCPYTFLNDCSSPTGIFTAQSLIFYTAGIKIFIALTANHGLSASAAAAVVFVSCVPLIFLGAEIFHRLVDVPSQWFARYFFIWIRR